MSCTRSFQYASVPRSATGITETFDINVGLLQEEVTGCGGYWATAIVVAASGQAPGGTPLGQRTINLRFMGSVTETDTNDSLGQLGVSDTFTTSDGLTWTSLDGNVVTTPNGIWGSNIGFSVSGGSGAFTTITGLSISISLLEDSDFVPGPSPPAAPTLLTAVADVVGGFIRLTWTDNATNELGFQVQRSVTSPPFISGGVNMGSTPINITQFDDYEVVDGTLYNYRVRAFNNDGHSAWSNIASEVFELPVPDIDLIGGAGGGITGSGAYSGLGVEVGGSPEIMFGIDLTGSGGVEVGGSPVSVMNVDASGIYTMVAGQTYDRIYNRQTGQATIDVKIPDPFGKTGFLGG